MGAPAKDSTIATVDFTMGGNLGRFTHHGLSQPEQSGAWTTAETSRIEIPIPVVPGSLTLHLVICAAPPGRRTISIFVGPQQVGSYTSRQTQWIELQLRIPPATLPRDGILQVRLVNSAPMPTPLVAQLQSGPVNGFLLRSLRLTSDAAAVAASAVTATSADPHRLPPPRLADEAELRFADCIAPARFGQAGQHECLRLFPSMMPPPQFPPRTLVNLPELLRDEHFQFQPPPDVNYYAIREGVIWGNGVVTSDNRFVLLPDCFPSYFRGQVTKDGHDLPIDILKPELWAGMSYLRSSRTVACFSHPNLVYGHFLLEMLPKLYLLRQLKALGCDFVVAMSTGLPDWAIDFARCYFEADDFMTYDPATQVVSAPSVIMASMMQTSHNFHPAFNMLVDDIQIRTSQQRKSDGTGNETWPTRIFLSRSRIPYNRRMLNEIEIEDAARDIGLEVIHPQELSVRQQVDLFSKAQLVVGEYSSALHNTMFSPFGTRVVSIDMYSWYQSAIGRLRQQPLAFVAPDDGRFRHWRTPGGPDRTYSIDPADFRRTVAWLEQG